MEEYELDNASLESKWAHLLKPIRDLTDNFSIDIAHELAEYLEQLEHTQFAIEGAGPPVDFAEAALLIQGSACIYSKKVEHLYNLVYQALDAVRHKRKAAGNEAGGEEGTQPTARGRSRAAAAAAADEPEDSNNLEACFWDVDAHLKPSDDIDLNNSTGGTGQDSNDDAAWLSARTPAMLQSLEDFSDSGGAGTTSSSCFLQQCAVHCSGALLLDPRDAHRYDAQLRRLQPHNITHTRNHHSAAAVVAPADAQDGMLTPEPMIDDGMDDDGGGGGADQWLGEGGSEDMGGGGGDGQSRAADDPAVPVAGMQPVQEASMGAGELLLSPSRPPGSVLRDARAPVAQSHAGGDVRLRAVRPPPAPGSRCGQRSRFKALPQACCLRRHALTPRTTARGKADPSQRVRQDTWTSHAQPGADGQQRQQEAGEGGPLDGDAAGDAPYFDPYDPLDHHAKGDLVIRPLLPKKPTKGMLARRAASVSAGGGLGVGGSSSSCGRMARLIGWLPAAAASLASTGLGSREFAYGLALLGIPAQSAAGLGSSRRELAKDRAAAAGRSGRGAVGLADVALFDAENPGAAARASCVPTETGSGLSQFAVNAQLDRDAVAALALASGLEPPAATDPAHGGHGSREGGGAAGYDVSGGDDGDGGGGGGYYDDAGGGGDSGDYDDVGLDVDALEGAQLQQQPDGGSYEELCRAHMDAMMAAAAAQQVQSDLAQRVNGWRSKIGPVLHDEETRPGFDIQEVGEAMLTRLGGLKLDDSAPAESLPLPEGGSGTSRPAGGLAPWVTFGSVAVRPRCWEVSRSFAALLQLINNRNVAIYKQGSAPDQPFQLQLLDACMAHHIMGDKIAATARPPPDNNNNNDNHSTSQQQNDDPRSNATDAEDPEGHASRAATSSSRQQIPAAVARKQGKGGKAVAGGRPAAAGQGRGGKKAAQRKAGVGEDSGVESEAESSDDGGGGGGESEEGGGESDGGGGGVENETVVVVVAQKGGRGKGAQAEAGGGREAGKHKSKRQRQALGNAAPS
ncbi:MAG: hypothetical protein WDW36_004966 [Sanguina aurantia]